MQVIGALRIEKDVAFHFKFHKITVNDCLLFYSKYYFPVL